MIRFDKGQTDVLAVCACGWRHHAANGSIQASQANADAAAHQHIGGMAHNVDELERRRAQYALSKRTTRRTE